MYSTASFVHAAGKTVTREGEMVSLDAAGDTAVYEFIPIEVRCDENGITAWQKATGPTNRHLSISETWIDIPGRWLTP